MEEAQPDVIEAEVRLEERDLVSAHREVADLRRVIRLLSLVQVLLMIVASGCCLLSSARESPMVALSGLALIAGGAFSLWRVRTRGSREWRSMEEWQRHLQFQLSSDGVRLGNEKERLDQAWDRFAGWSESDSAFYLEQAGSRFLILPKRAFDGDAAVEAVRSLLREHVRSRPDLRKRGPLLVLVLAVLTGVVGLVFVGGFIAYYQLVVLPALEQSREPWPEEAPSLREER